MMKRFIFLSKIVFFCLFAQAGKVDKGFEALNEYNYFEARKLFLKALEKSPAPAAYGLSVIYGRADNPFHHPDTAYNYILKSDSAYHQLETKEKEALAVLKLDSVQILNWKDSLDFLAYQRVKYSRTIAACNHFLALHLTATQIPRVRQLRNALAFEQARAKDDYEAYAAFIRTYPQSAQISEAKRRYEERLFQAKTKAGTLAAYRQFLQQYPKSPYRGTTEDLLYEAATKEKNLKSYEIFVKSDPQNRNVGKAWRNIYRLFTNEYSPQRIAEFRLDYPDYPFMRELMQDYRLSQERFYPFKQDNKWGFMNETGIIRIPAIYSYADDFVDGLALVYKNGKAGFVDKSGKEVIPLQYEEAESFVEGLAMVVVDDQFGMINRANKAIVPIKYDEVGELSDGMIMVNQGDRYGFMNQLGELVIPMDYQSVGDFENGFVNVQNSEGWGIIDRRAEVVVPMTHDWIENFNPYGLARARVDSLFGIYDYHGALVDTFQYAAIGEFADSLALVAKGGTYGYINSKMELVIPMKYDYRPEVLAWGTFENGAVKVAVKDKYGIMDVKGERVYPAIFQDVGSYGPGTYTAVKKRGKWGYSNDDLKLVIPYEYELTQTFFKGLGIVRKDGFWGMLDSEGEEVLPASYEQIKWLGDSLIMAKTAGKWGLFSAKTEVLLDANYQNIRLQEQWLALDLGEHLYYYDPKRQQMIKPQDLAN